MFGRKKYKWEKAFLTNKIPLHMDRRIHLTIGTIIMMSGQMLEGFDNALYIIFERSENNQDWLGKWRRDLSHWL